MSFLGPVGSIIPVKCASQLTSSGGRSVSFEDTLGKRKAFLGKVKARQWSVDIGLAKPSELSGLRWLAENVNSPMVWYGPDAVVGNILTPPQSDFAPGTHNGLPGPLVEVEPGVWVKSGHPDGPVSFRFPYKNGAPDILPVVAGHPVTIAVWARGGPMRISVFWFDWNGDTITSDVGENHTHLRWQRMSRTVVPPVGAVSMEVRVVDATQVAGPTVTLSDRVLPYSPGKGATKVVAHGLVDAVIRATENQQLESLSFTVSEVG